jgi:hypothetical protein
MSRGSPKGIYKTHVFGKVAGDVGKWGGQPWKRVLPMNITGAPGISGAPVFTKDGNIVGLFVGGPKPWGNYGVAAPASSICKLLARAVY